MYMYMHIYIYIYIYILEYEILYKDRSWAEASPSQAKACLSADYLKEVVSAFLFTGRVSIYFEL